MFPAFFRQKMREVASFLRMMKGKVTRDEQERIRGEDQALNAAKDEPRIYQGEKAEAMRGSDSEIGLRRQDPQEKVLRESGGQDISAI